ncbi:MAG: IS200/IS605 family element transposase accessory protein TnpB [Eubacterium sp.]|nr:IS200/IS605 family element transposase accessory protein TnpB [Eubacterium sp.]
MIVQRVEKHIIKPSNIHYALLDKFCFQSKNLYNHANFIMRHEFLKNRKAVPYGGLDKILKADEAYPDYRAMPTAQSAQQVLRLLEKNWKSFFKSIKDWTKNKDKYTGKPKLPKYKKKDSRNILILTNQNVKLRDGALKFPKKYEGFSIKLKCCERNNFDAFHQVRFIPKQGFIVLEVVYSISICEAKPDNQRYCSIDIGIDNLAAVTANTGCGTYIINGRGLKSVNKYYNKQMSHYRGVAKRMNGMDFTKRMARITAKRNRKMEDYMHKAGRKIVDNCMDEDIHTIVIGYNKNWKRDTGLGRNVNQSFAGIPTRRFIEMIQYKAQEAGINVILTEESYTSGTSFLDGEEPVKKNYNKSRRIHRGLFHSNNGTQINADINASYQILKKVFPAAYANGVEGVVLHPFRVNAAFV